MNSEASKSDSATCGHDAHGESWFVTFSVLDFSSVISSSQWERLLTAIKRLWR